MKAKQIIAAIAVLAATGTAFAQQTEFVPADAGFQSTKSRAEVRSELEQAYRQGQIVTQTNDASPEFASIAKTLHRSRQDVRAEQAAAAHDRSFENLYFGA